MEDEKKAIEELWQRLKKLERQQAQNTSEVNELRKALHALTTEEIPLTSNQEKRRGSPDGGAVPPSASKRSGLRRPRTDLERFIGENLINKIGIVITIIGVAIGVKYSIDQDLMGTTARAVLVYTVGGVLLGIGFKLKAKYEQYSAVLVSGAMAIVYFITYASYTFYGLYSQVLTFALMAALTVFTVLMALWYNRQVIAHIGLVGAYAVPFLLSNGSGSIQTLLIYVVVVNLGIFFIALKKYWKALFYVSFFCSWLILSAWLFGEYQAEEHFVWALAFLSMFFVLFYSSFLGYKARHKEDFNGGDLFLLISNTFLFFGYGSYILHRQQASNLDIGLFTVITGLVHGFVSMLLYRVKQFDKKLLYFLSGLALVFFTIAIPVYFEANWVTLLWAAEAGLLFYIGRSRKIFAYERLAYPLLLLTVLSLLHDWIVGYALLDFTGKDDDAPTSLMNIYFFTTCVVSLMLAAIVRWQHNLPVSHTHGRFVNDLMQTLVPLLLLGVLYFGLFIEVYNWWDTYHILLSSAHEKPVNRSLHTDIAHAKQLWLINYSLFFFTVISWVNIKFIQNTRFGILNLGINLLVLLIYLHYGQKALHALLESYEKGDAFFGLFNIGMRYVSVVFIGGVLFTCYRYVRQQFLPMVYQRPLDLILHFILLLLLSSELVQWLELAGNQHVFKLGISILWGGYALLLISLGIWRGKKHLRVSAILLFGATLVKVFLYDLSSYSAFSKTIAFVSLGMLLLIISFLYNKYSHLVTGEEGLYKKKKNSEEQS